MYLLQVVIIFSMAYPNLSGKKYLLSPSNVSQACKIVALASRCGVQVREVILNILTWEKCQT